MPVDPDEVVSVIAAEPRDVALFTDFDGTLSEVVPDPETAVLVPGAADDLAALGRTLGRTVVVSGRPAAWLARRIGPEAGRSIELFGLHGVERWDGSAAVATEAARPFVTAVASAREAANAAAIEGMVVEDKVFSLTLHWRGAEGSGLTGTAAAVEALAFRLAGELGLSPLRGKKSVELVPPIGVDKGSVVSERGQGFGVVVSLGDDVSDLPAFAALDRFEEAGSTVARIAVVSGEAPAGLREQADLVFDGPVAAGRWLSQLVEALGLRTARG